VWSYAQQAWAAGHGLLWNELQSSGQPFLAIPSTALLYPPTWLLSSLEMSSFLEIWIVLHLMLAGAASWGLARALGQTRFAACATAFAVQVASPAPFFALWSPIVLSTYAWLPVALLACERLLQRRDGTAACTLALVLAVQSTAGFPQILVFTYELIGLRIAWELMRHPVVREPRTLGLLAAALVMPLLLAAVQILPALEVFAASVRSAPMTAAEVDFSALPGSALDRLRSLISSRSSSGGLFPVAFVLAGAGLALATPRRIALFYGLAAAFFLALIADTPLRESYQALPVVGRLRGPERFRWVSSMCVCLLLGFGVDALTRARSVGDRGAVVMGALLGAISFWLLAGTGFTLIEASLSAGTVAFGILTSNIPRARLATGLAVFAALAASAYPAFTRPSLRLIAGEEELRTAHAVFEIVDHRRTNQDRTLVFPTKRAIGGDLGAIEKSPSLYGIPSVSDYEHLTSLRYANVYSFMVRGRPLETAGEWSAGVLGEAPRFPALLDLLAARYVLTGLGMPSVFKPMRLIGPERSSHRLLENRRALPRAHFAARAAVLRDLRATLERLASRDHDPRRTVLLPEIPQDGWLGKAADPLERTAHVTIERSRSEQVEIRVDTPVPGFLVLTDQFAGGWSASVDGVPVELLRANHAFRAVRVPAGDSTVIFRYRPKSLYLGAAVSALSLTAIAAFALRASACRSASAAS
jgi:hypothetical protein